VANADGAGWAYSAQALALANPGAVPKGHFSYGGVTYSWPGEIGAPDNITTGGQTLTFGSKAGKMIYFLGSATESTSSGATGNFVITFADGSSQTTALTFSDWTLGGGSFAPVAGNAEALTTSYRWNNACNCKDGTMTYVYAVSAGLNNTTSNVASVTLPSGTINGTTGAIHIFDIQIQ
jgi:hypothetical protein